jgi:DNA repair protein RadC
MPDEEYAGHRSRLLLRFEENGCASLQDYEIVELILTFAIPRKDTKPIAKDLLRRYKTLSGLLHADRDDVAMVPGVGRRAGLLFTLFRDVATYCLAEKYHKRPIIHHRHDVQEYLRFAFGLRPTEYVAVLFLDNGNNVIETEIVHEGTVNQCAVYPRTIIEKALRYKATSIIMAHNHPGGSVEPSQSDWAITERLFNICTLMDMPLLDHVIVARDAVVSLKDLPKWAAMR